MIICGVILLIIHKYKNIWLKDYYVDDFGRKTEDSYISLKKRLGGTYINSSGQYGSMEYTVTIDESSVTFNIWDYGRYQVNNDTSNVVNLDIKCLGNTTNEVLYSTLRVYSYSSNLNLVEDKDKFIELLKNNKSVKIIIKNGVEEYDFNLRQGNLLKILEKNG